MTVKKPKKKKDRTKKIGNDIYTVEPRYSIPEGCIHIYIGKKIGIGLSRKFLDQLKVLGMKKWKRTSKMKYDHPDMSAYVTIIDDRLDISIYREEMSNMRTKLHNFLLGGFTKEFSDEIRKRFPVVARACVDKDSMMFKGDSRNPNVFHMSFDLKEAKIIGQKQTDTRDYFV